MFFHGIFYSYRFNGRTWDARHLTKIVASSKTGKTIKRSTSLAEKSNYAKTIDHTLAKLLVQSTADKLGKLPPLASIYPTEIEDKVRSPPKQESLALYSQATRQKCLLTPIKSFYEQLNFYQRARNQGSRMKRIVSDVSNQKDFPKSQYLLSDFKNISRFNIQSPQDTHMRARDSTYTYHNHMQAQVFPSTGMQTAYMKEKDRNESHIFARKHREESYYSPGKDKVCKLRTDYGSPREYNILSNRSENQMH